MSLRLWPAAAAVLLAGGLPGCMGSDEQAQAEQAALAAQAGELAVRLDEQTAEAAGIVVRLAFGEEADLDLYVTDPLLDTVYFARHETRTGGRISADVRCDTPGPRVEEVRFEVPWAGRYRVGVDHPKRCDGARAPAAYAVTAQVDGKTYRASGSVALEQFQIVVLEFELQEGAADEQALEIN
jgi:uncharacterized protein YfaP (DUF2135 family)